MSPDSWSNLSDILHCFNEFFYLHDVMDVDAKFSVKLSMSKLKLPANLA